MYVCEFSEEFSPPEPKNSANTLILLSEIENSVEVVDIGTANVLTPCTWKKLLPVKLKIH